MFRIIHCSSSIPGSMKKSDWVVRLKKANVENDGMEREEEQGKQQGEGTVGGRENKDKKN